MENYQLPPQEMYCGVTVKPDREEKKQIRRKYLKVGAVIVVNMILFNFVLLGIIYLIGNFIGDGGSVSERTKEMLGRYDGLSTVFSCAIPIISETVSIILGIKLLKLDIKSLFTLNGFTGAEVVWSTVISLGLQTLAAVLTVIINALLKAAGFMSVTADLSACTSVGATIFMYFYACLLGPVLEELLYRGVVLQGMRKYNERFAVIVSSLIFGLMHQNYQQFLLGFMVGLIFAAITLRSGSLVPSVIMHIIVNTSGVLAQLIMQNADYPAFERLASGDVDLSDISGGFAVAMVLNAIFRYGMLFAGIVLMIISMVRHIGVRKPTPAGKTRGWPVLAQCWIWYVILAGYIYLMFATSIEYIGRG